MDFDTSRNTAVAAALRAGEWPDEADWIIGEGVGLLIAAIGRGDAPLSPAEASAAAETLNQYRRYALTCRLAEAWRARGRFDLRLGRHHVQAIIESGSLDEAAERIAGLLARAELLPADTPRQRAAIAEETTELRGLAGRVAKDAFVHRRKNRTGYDALCDRLLRKAQRIYAAEYRQDPARYWQGINALALEARRGRERDRPPAADFPQRVHALLQPLLAQVEAHETRRPQRPAQTAPSAADAAWLAADRRLPWMLATISEAQLALGDCGEAEHWLQRMMDHAESRPRHLASYARQLREIWDGDALQPHLNCAGRLAARLLAHERTEQNTVTLSALQLEALREIDTEHERQFSDDTGLDFLTIATACDSIGRVCSMSSLAKGSGFLIDRRQLWPEGPGGLVFVTNAHVISPDFGDAALRPEDACVLFSTEPLATRQPAQPHRVGRVLFTSPPQPMSVLLPQCVDLDITIVELESLPPRARGLEVNLTLPNVGQPAYVIGYPGQSDIRLSVGDSDLVDRDTLPRLFHYRTPTDRGSSGSPVFNTDWQVVGVHHAGGCNKPMLTRQSRHNANEGIALWALHQCLIQQRRGAGA